jgi:predicted phosphodiesterase
VGRRSAMRIAVIADIQGNIQALEAVLADIKKWVPDLLLVGGDIILHGPDSLGVLELLSTIDHTAVCGNCEKRVLQVPEEESLSDHPIEKLARFTRRQIGTHWCNYISNFHIIYPLKSLYHNKFFHLNSFFY